MKNSFFLALCSALALPVFSQNPFVIDQSTLQNETDQGIVFGGTISGDVWIDEGATGAGLTYDITGITPQYELSISYYNAEDDEYTEEYFSEADVVWKKQVLGGFSQVRQYVRNDPEGAFRIGIYQDSQGPQFSTCDDQKELLQFPATMDVTWTDTYSSVIAGTPAGFQSEEEGTITGLVDAVDATLIGPGYTIPNITRIRKEEKGEFTSFIDGEPFGEPTFFERLTFEFWSPLYGYPVATFIQYSYSSQVFLEAEFITGNPLGTNRQIDQSEILIYPNPASEQAIIRLPKDFNISSLLIIDPSGRKVFEDQIGIAIHQEFFNLDLVDFSEGLYMVLIYSEKDVLSQKLIITR